MDTTIPYEEGGRTEQKARTRAAIVAAARNLIDGGEDATVYPRSAHASIGPDLHQHEALASYSVKEAAVAQARRLIDAHRYVLESV